MRAMAIPRFPSVDRVEEPSVDRVETVNNHLTVLRRMLMVAKKRGLIESVPEVECGHVEAGGGATRYIEDALERFEDTAVVASRPRIERVAHRNARPDRRDPTSGRASSTCRSSRSLRQPRAALARLRDQAILVV